MPFCWLPANSKLIIPSCSALGACHLFSMHDASSTIIHKGAFASRTM